MARSLYQMFYDDRSRDIITRHRFDIHDARCLPDSDGKHVEDVSALDPAQKHDDADDTERVERKLFAQHTHADLQRRFLRLEGK